MHYICITSSVWYTTSGQCDDNILNIPSSTLNIHTPGLPILLVWLTLIMSGVSDPGTVMELIPSPALIPARASVPPTPLVPPEASPVVHWISV